MVHLGSENIAQESGVTWGGKGKRFPGILSVLFHLLSECVQVVKKVRIRRQTASFCKERKVAKSNFVFPNARGKSRWKHIQRSGRRYGNRIAIEHWLSCLGSILVFWEGWVFYEDRTELSKVELESSRGGNERRTRQNDRARKSNRLKRQIYCLQVPMSLRDEHLGWQPCEIGKRTANHFVAPSAFC